MNEEVFESFEARLPGLRKLWSAPGSAQANIVSIVSIIVSFVLDKSLAGRNISQMDWA